MNQTIHLTNTTLHTITKYYQDMSDIITSDKNRHHMTSGRMPGAGHDQELPPVPLCAPPRVGHNICTGGGEPTSPALTQMRYVFSLGEIERDASGHGNVFQGCGVETEVAEGKGGADEHDGEIPGLWDTLGYGDGI